MRNEHRQSAGSGLLLGMAAGEDRQCAQVDVAEILHIRRNKEGGDNGQHSGCGEDRFLLNELFE